MVMSGRTSCPKRFLFSRIEDRPPGSVIGFGVGLLMSGIVNVAVALTSLPVEAVVAAAVVAEDVAAVVAAGDPDVDPLDAVVAVDVLEVDPDVVVDVDEVVVLVPLLPPQASSSVPTTPTMPSKPPARSRPRRLSDLPQSEKPSGSFEPGESFISRFTFVILLLDFRHVDNRNTDELIVAVLILSRINRRDEVLLPLPPCLRRSSAYSRPPQIVLR